MLNLQIYPSKFCYPPVPPANSTSLLNRSYIQRIRLFSGTEENERGSSKIEKFAPRFDGFICLVVRSRLFSLATLSWLNPLLSTGARRPLDLKDIPLLAPKDRSKTCYNPMTISNFLILMAASPPGLPSMEANTNLGEFYGMPVMEL